MQTKTTHALIALLLFSATAHAKGPEHTVFPQLSALSVSYAVESNEIRSIVYATNHEEFAVICDAEMKTDKQESQRQKETRVEAGKTIGLTFKYRPAVTKIQLYLMCEPAPEAKAEAAKAASSKDHIRTTHYNRGTLSSETENAPTPVVHTEELSTP